MTEAVWKLARGAAPAVAVATVIPMALFYAVLSLGTVPAAVVVSVLYAYGIAAYQYARNRRVSGMLMMTVLMATVRAVTALSGHATASFAIPIAETAGFGLMFLATMFSSEPLVVRLARDLVPHAAPGIASQRTLIRALSIVWTVTYLGSGATTLALLALVPLPVFVGAHTLAGWVWTGAGMAISLGLCRRRSAALLAV